jgi:hypothetical protein
MGKRIKRKKIFQTARHRTSHQGPFIEKTIIRKNNESQTISLQKTMILVGYEPQESPARQYRHMP